MLINNINYIKPLAVFLTAPGYYLVMMVFFKIGLASDSRFFTVPYRLFMVGIFIYFLTIKYKKFKPAIYSNNFFFLCIVTFWIIYLSRMLYDVYWLDLPLSMNANDFILYAVSFGLLPLLFFSIRSDDASYRRTELLMAIGSMTLSLAAFFLYREVFSESSGRLRGLEENMESTISPLAVSYISIFSFALGFFKIFINRQLSVFNIVMVLSSIPGILMGSSRGAIVALLFSYAFLSASKKKILPLIFLTMVIIFSYPLMELYSEQFGSALFNRLANTTQNWEIEKRMIGWENAIDNFIENPVLGDYIENRGIGHHPHNIIIEAFMATGIIGGIPFLLIMLYSFHMAFNIGIRSNQYDWLIIFFTLNFAQNMVTGSIWGSSWLWCSIGLMVPVYEKIKRSSVAFSRNDTRLSSTRL